MASKHFQQLTGRYLKSGIRVVPNYAASSLSISRQLSTSTSLRYPRKDAQDKDSIHTEANEYSKSATDDEAARQEDAAFNPDLTDPQEQKDVAGKDTAVRFQVHTYEKN